MFQLPSFRFTPQEQQEPQVIDPRAAYEQRSVLADTLLRNSQQYQGGGAIGALAMIANAFAAKKMGERAQGSLSAALEQEAERERQAAEAERAAADLKYQRDLERLREESRLSRIEWEERQRAEQEAWRSRFDYEIANTPQPTQEPQQLPPLTQATIDRAAQLRDAGLISPEKHDEIVNTAYGINLGGEVEDEIPDDATTRTALGKLNQAQAALDDYKEASFKLENWDGQGAPDFRELPSLSVDRGGIFENAVQNLLYAKSGASAPDAEVRSYMSQFEPGVFSTDAVNWDRIQRLEQDIQTQREALLGRGGEGGIPRTQQQPQQPQRRSREQVLADYRRANPQMTDEQLEREAIRRGDM